MCQWITGVMEGISLLLRDGKVAIHARKQQTFAGDIEGHPADNNLGLTLCE